MHHIAEAVRLLRATAPEGFEVRSFHWTPDLGPLAPEDFIVTARNARDIAHFRPRYYEGWRIRKPDILVSIPITG